jgi:hypothetical protein
MLFPPLLLGKLHTFSLPLLLSELNTFLSLLAQSVAYFSPFVAQETAYFSLTFAAIGQMDAFISLCDSVSCILYSPFVA